MNNFEQVSSVVHQMSVAGGPTSDVWGCGWKGGPGCDVPGGRAGAGAGVRVVK